MSLELVPLARCFASQHLPMEFWMYRVLTVKVYDVDCGRGGEGSVAKQQPAEDIVNRLGRGAYATHRRSSSHHRAPHR